MTYQHSTKKITVTITQRLNSIYQRSLYGAFEYSYSNKKTKIQDNYAVSSIRKKAKEKRTQDILDGNFK